MTNICTRRSFIKAIGLIGGALSFKTSAQQTSTRHRIGFLIGEAPTLISAFEQEMQRLGYEPGKNIVIEKRISRNNTPDLVGQAAELSAMDLELIVAAALPQALEVRKSNPKMPMVIATCPGMVSNGFTTADPNDAGMLDVVGFDMATPSVMADFATGGATRPADAEVE